MFSLHYFYHKTTRRKERLRKSGYFSKALLILKRFLISDTHSVCTDTNHGLFILSLFFYTILGVFTETLLCAHHSGRFWVNKGGTLRILTHVLRQMIQMTGRPSNSRGNATGETETGIAVVYMKQSALLRRKFSLQR